MEHGLTLYGVILVVLLNLLKQLLPYIFHNYKPARRFLQVLSDVAYCWYAGYFVDEAKRFFLPVW